MEKESRLERCLLFVFECLFSGIIIETKCVVTTGLECMIIFIICFPQELVIDIDSFPILTHVKITVRKPQAILNLNVDIPLTFQ